MHATLHLRVPNFVVIERSAGNYDVISIFRDVGHRVGNLHPGSALVTASVTLRRLKFIFFEDPIFEDLIPRLT